MLCSIITIEIKLSLKLTNRELLWGQHYRTFLEQNKLVRLTRQNIDVQGPALLDNNGLNALAYHEKVKVSVQKSFIDLTPGASKLAPMTA